VAEFRISTELHGASVVVSVQGELDVTSSQRFDDCLSEAGERAGHVILDLSRVDFMDTTALAVIVGHWRRTMAAGGTFLLAGARYRYTKALWITGLADRLPMFGSVDEALAAQSGGTQSEGAQPRDTGPDTGSGAASGPGARMSGEPEATAG
jgi:anti-sigma B factor antagonist